MGMCMASPQMLSNQLHSSLPNGIALVGTAKYPTTDDGTISPTASRSVSPPGGMEAGDVVVVVTEFAALISSSGITVTATGGQDWTAMSASLSSTRVFCCEFNGEWTADPAFGYTSSQQFIVYMMVWRGVTLVDAVYAAKASPPPSAPYHVTADSVTTVADDSLVLFMWGTGDNNTWSLVSGDVANVNSETQWRANSFGASVRDLSVSLAWKVVEDAGASGFAVNQQTTLGGDAPAVHVLALKPAI